MSWKLLVTTTGDDEPSANSLRFSSQNECMLYGEDLRTKWTAVRTMETVESEDPITASFVDGTLRGDDGQEI